MITIATDDLQPGHNDDINEEQQIQKYQFESPKDDFELVPADPALQAADNQIVDQTIQKEVDQTIQKEADQTIQKEANIQKEEQKLTHEENKLLLTLSGVIFGSIIMWTLR